MLQEISLCFQRLPFVAGGSMQHEMQHGLPVCSAQRRTLSTTPRPDFLESAKGGRSPYDPMTIAAAATMGLTGVDVCCRKCHATTQISGI